MIKGGDGNSFSNSGLDNSGDSGDAVIGNLVIHSSL